MREALISIRPTYVRKFLAGKKSVELRSRTVNLMPGSRLWMYSTLPRGCVEAVAEVRRVEIGTPSAIWDRHGGSLAVSKATYASYVNGSRSVSAILIDRVWPLPVKLTLSMLRLRVPTFQPPQFVKYMADSDPLFINIIRLLSAGASSDYIQQIGLKSQSSRCPEGRG